MQAQVVQVGDVTLVRLAGKIDYESTQPFRDTCLQRWRGEKVIFDLAQLNFVGSHGIRDFVETFEQLCQVPESRATFIGLSCEFQRIFESSQIDRLRIFDSADKALASFIEM